MLASQPTARIFLVCLLCTGVSGQPGPSSQISYKAPQQALFCDACSVRGDQYQSESQRHAAPACNLHLQGPPFPFWIFACTVLLFLGTAFAVALFLRPLDSAADKEDDPGSFTADAKSVTNPGTEGTTSTSSEATVAIITAPEVNDTGPMRTDASFACCPADCVTRGSDAARQLKPPRPAHAKIKCQPQASFLRQHSELQPPVPASDISRRSSVTPTFDVMAQQEHQRSLLPSRAVSEGSSAILRTLMLLGPDNQSAVGAATSISTGQPRSAAAATSSGRGRGSESADATLQVAIRSSCQQTTDQPSMTQIEAASADNGTSNGMRSPRCTTTATARDAPSPVQPQLRPPVVMATAPTVMVASPSAAQSGGVDYPRSRIEGSTGVAVSGGSGGILLPLPWDLGTLQDMCSSNDDDDGLVTRTTTSWLPCTMSEGGAGIGYGPVRPSVRPKNQMSRGQYQQRAQLQMQIQLRESQLQNLRMRKLQQQQQRQLRYQMRLHHSPSAAAAAAAVVEAAALAKSPSSALPTSYSSLLPYQLGWASMAPTTPQVLPYGTYGSDLRQHQHARPTALPPSTSPGGLLLPSRAVSVGRECLNQQMSLLNITIPEEVDEGAATDLSAAPSAATAVEESLELQLLSPTNGPSASPVLPSSAGIASSKSSSSFRGLRSTASQGLDEAFAALVRAGDVSITPASSSSSSAVLRCSSKMPSSSSSTTSARSSGPLVPLSYGVTPYITAGAATAIEPSNSVVADAGAVSNAVMPEEGHSKQQQELQLHSPCVTEASFSVEPETWKRAAPAPVFTPAMAIQVAAVTPGKGVSELGMLDEELVVEVMAPNLDLQVEAMAETLAPVALTAGEAGGPDAGSISIAPSLPPSADLHRHGAANPAGCGFAVTGTDSTDGGSWNVFTAGAAAAAAVAAAAMTSGQSSVSLLQPQPPPAPAVTSSAEGATEGYNGAILVEQDPSPQILPYVPPYNECDMLAGVSPFGWCAGLQQLEQLQQYQQQQQQHDEVQIQQQRLLQQQQWQPVAVTAPDVSTGVWNSGLTDFATAAGPVQPPQLPLPLPLPDTYETSTFIEGVEGLSGPPLLLPPPAPLLRSCSIHADAFSQQLAEAFQSVTDVDLTSLGAEYDVSDRLGGLPPMASNHLPRQGSVRRGLPLFASPSWSVGRSPSAAAAASPPLYTPMAAAATPPLPSSMQPLPPRHPSYMLPRGSPAVSHRTPLARPSLQNLATLRQAQMPPPPPSQPVVSLPREATGSVSVVTPVDGAAADVAVPRLPLPPPPRTSFRRSRSENASDFIRSLNVGGRGGDTGTGGESGPVATVAVSRDPRDLSPPYSPDSLASEDGNRENKDHMGLSAQPPALNRMTSWFSHAASGGPDSVAPLTAHIGYCVSQPGPLSRSLSSRNRCSLEEARVNNALHDGSAVLSGGLAGVLPSRSASVSSASSITGVRPSSGATSGSGNLGNAGGGVGEGWPWSTAGVKSTSPSWTTFRLSFDGTGKGFTSTQVDPQEKLRHECLQLKQHSGEVTVEPMVGSETAKTAAASMLFVGQQRSQEQQQVLQEQEQVLHEQPHRLHAASITRRNHPNPRQIERLRLVRPRQEAGPRQDWARAYTSEHQRPQSYEPYWVPRAMPDAVCPPMPFGPLGGTNTYQVQSEGGAAQRAAGGSYCQVCRQPPVGADECSDEPPANAVENGGGGHDGGDNGGGGHDGGDSGAESTGTNQSGNGNSGGRDVSPILLGRCMATSLACIGASARAGGASLEGPTASRPISNLPFPWTATPPAAADTQATASGVAASAAPGAIPYSLQRNTSTTGLADFAGEMGGTATPDRLHSPPLPSMPPLRMAPGQPPPLYRSRFSTRAVSIKVNDHSPAARAAAPLLASAATRVALHLLTAAAGVAPPAPSASAPGGRSPTAPPTPALVTQRPPWAADSNLSPEPPAPAVAITPNSPVAGADAPGGSSAMQRVTCVPGGGAGRLPRLLTDTGTRISAAVVCSVVVPGCLQLVTWCRAASVISSAGAVRGNKVTTTNAPNASPRRKPWSADGTGGGVGVGGGGGGGGGGGSSSFAADLLRALSCPDEPKGDVGNHDKIAGCRSSLVPTSEQDGGDGVFCTSSLPGGGAAGPPGMGADRGDAAAVVTEGGNFAFVEPACLVVGHRAHLVLKLSPAALPYEYGNDPLQLCGPYRSGLPHLRTVRLLMMTSCGDLLLDELVPVCPTDLTIRLHLPASASQQPGGVHLFALSNAEAAPQAAERGAPDMGGGEPCGMASPGPPHPAAAAAAAAARTRATNIPATCGGGGTSPRHEPLEGVLLGRATLLVVQDERLAAEIAVVYGGCVQHYLSSAAAAGQCTGVCEYDEDICQDESLLRLLPVSWRRRRAAAAPNKGGEVATTTCPVDAGGTAVEAAISLSWQLHVQPLIADLDLVLSTWSDCVAAAAAQSAPAAVATSENPDAAAAAATATSAATAAATAAAAAAAVHDWLDMTDTLVQFCREQDLPAAEALLSRHAADVHIWQQKRQIQKQSQQQLLFSRHPTEYGLSELTESPTKAAGASDVHCQGDESRSGRMSPVSAARLKQLRQPGGKAMSHSSWGHGVFLRQISVEATEATSRRPEADCGDLAGGAVLHKTPEVILPSRTHPRSISSPSPSCSNHGITASVTGCLQLPGSTTSTGGGGGGGGTAVCISAPASTAHADCFHARIERFISVFSSPDSGKWSQPDLKQVVPQPVIEGRDSAGAHPGQSTTATSISSAKAHGSNTQNHLAPPPPPPPLLTLLPTQASDKENRMPGCAVVDGGRDGRGGDRGCGGSGGGADVCRATASLPSVHPTPASSAATNLRRTMRTRSANLPTIGLDGAVVPLTGAVKGQPASRVALLSMTVRQVPKSGADDLNSQQRSGSGMKAEDDNGGGLSSGGPRSQGRNDSCSCFSLDDCSAGGGGGGGGGRGDYYSGGGDGDTTTGGCEPCRSGMESFWPQPEGPLSPSAAGCEQTIAQDGAAAGTSTMTEVAASVEPGSRVRWGSPVMLVLAAAAAMAMLALFGFAAHMHLVCIWPSSVHRGGAA